MDATALPVPTVTISRDDLLDLLTTAACIGKHDIPRDTAQTRGDITDELLKWPVIRRALPKDA